MSTPFYPFGFTSGDPDRLFGDGSADMQDIQGPLFDLRDFLNSGNVLFLGEVRYSTTGAPSPLWLLCNGAAVSRAGYPQLFAAIGTTYGAGNGTTTFNLPNVTGSVVPAYIYANA